MAETNRVNIIITGDSKDAVKAFADVETHSRGLRDTIKSMGQQILSVAGGMALFDIGKRVTSGLATAGMEINSMLEQATVQFKVLSGSAKEATDTVAYLYKYAAKTPFEFPGVLKASSIVKGAKLEMQKWIPIIGDMAAAGKAAGLAMDDVSMALARIKSGNVGEFFERVGAYLGITRQDLEKYGIAWTDAGALADRSAQGIQKLLDAIYQEANRKFKGMASEQSNTFAGMWSTIKDTYNMIQGEMFRPFFDYMKGSILPTIRETSDRFLEAYRAGGMLAGLKTIFPSETAGILNRISEAGSSVNEAFSQMWQVIRPLASQMGQLATGTFKGVVIATTELTRSTADMISKIMQIPGASLMIQALAVQFLLFRGVIPILQGLGRTIIALPGIIKMVQVAQMQWFLGAQAGVGILGRLIGIIFRFGSALLASVFSWQTAAAAGVMAAALVIRNWEKVAPFFQASGKVIFNAINSAFAGIGVGVAEVALGVRKVWNGMLSWMADDLAQLLDAVLPIIPSYMRGAMENARSAVSAFAEGNRNAIRSAAGDLDVMKGAVKRYTNDLSAAWKEFKNTGSNMLGAIVTDVKGMANAVKENFKSASDAVETVTEVVQDSGQQITDAITGINADISDLERKNADYLDSILDDLKDTYKEKMAIIDSETDSEIKRLESKLNRLNEDEQGYDREKAREQHEKRLADLAEKRQYHELRTGLEHQKAIVEIDKEIAEEKAKWQEQQHRWTLDDQQDQVREEIELARERGRKRREELEREFDKTLDLYEGQFRDMTAQLGVFEPKYLAKYKEIGYKAIAALVSGATDGLPELEQLQNEISNMLPGMQQETGQTVTGQNKMKKKVIPPGQYELIGGMAAMSARELALLLGLAAPTFANGMVHIGGKSFSPLDIRNGRAWLSVRDVASAFGWGVNYDSPTGVVRLDKAHSGAKVLSDGPAILKKDERVLSPQLSAAFEKLVGALGDGAGAGVTVNIDAPLMEVKEARFNDRADMEYTGRTIMGGILAVAAAKGRGF